MGRGLPAARTTEFLVLGAVISLSFGFLLFAPMIYDDRSFILASPAIAGAWAGGKALLFSGGGGEAFEPLVALLHRGIYVLFGARPFPYRLTSLLLHWANSCLVLILFSRELRDRRLAFGAALLFAVFPGQVEVLALSTFKKHLLVAAAALSSLLLLDDDSRPAALRVGGSWLLFAAALAAKETAVVLPALAAARLAAERGGRSKWRGNAALFGGWTAILAVYVFIRARFAPRAPGVWQGGGRLAHALTSFKILSWDLGRLLFPWPPSLEHSLAPASAGAGALCLALIALSAGLAGAVVLYRRDRRMWFAAAWILAALAPFLNFVPSLNYSLVADRYLYLASAGWFLLAALAVEKFLAPSRLRRLAPIFLVLTAAYAVASANSAALFVDPRDVWGNAARRAPGNPRAHAAYGAALAEAGRDGEAVAELRRSIELDPDYLEPYFDLARIESREGRPAEATVALEERARRRPDADGRRALGLDRLKAGRVAEALKELDAALAAAPEDLRTRLDMGEALLAARRWGSAGRFFREAAADGALRARALCGLGAAASGEGRAAEAAVFFRESLALNPWNARVAELLAGQDLSLGRRGEAFRALDDALARWNSLPSTPDVDAVRAELSRRRAALLTRR